MLDKLGITIPLIQAPMAGVATPLLAAEVSNAGALGSIGVGATDATGARLMIDELHQRTNRAFNVNFFAHEAGKADARREAAWLGRLAPLFAEFGAEPPKQLKTIYKSFKHDPELLPLMLEKKPAVVSFHFGLPSEEAVRALKQANITLLASATSLDEALLIKNAGFDAVIAQGIEAGGHRGIFDPNGADDGLSAMTLTQILTRELDLPVITAGGIMNGAGIAAALNYGAVAAQMGTAFIACPESAADDAYRIALQGDGAHHTVLTPIISGRPARSLANHYTALQTMMSDLELPAYPIAYDAAKALHEAAKAKDESGFGAQWAGQGAPLSRAMPAAELVALLAQELESFYPVKP
ncbi:NAD(P)H-dependent flavin oxidoreductase [Paenochrobactrum pullorum]|uniref:NAD(P)H-dependent flavin oxidoreductase n=1 Tax=Paenochrobactrum pullorum TaxID=1324351 RepID=UPI0035BC2C8C